jgi:hypothetical protein
MFKKDLLILTLAEIYEVFDEMELGRHYRGLAACLRLRVVVVA